MTLEQRLDNLERSNRNMRAGLRRVPTRCDLHCSRKDYLLSLKDFRALV